MTYKDTYLTGKQLADKIRSGAMREERKSQTPEVDIKSGLIPRRQREEAQAQRAESENNFYQDLVMSYLIGNKEMRAAAEAQGQSQTPSWYGNTDYSGVALSSKDVDLGTIAVGIREAADELGIDPVDLATVISYETGGTFNPTISGPTTKWGTHRGLIQFGEPQAQEYGVDWNDPYGSQLGRDGAVVRYLRENGVTPGMKLLDIYSTINAGAPGLYDRSDTAAGGAPGTVRDKVNTQMEGHYKKALALIHGSKPQANPRRT